MFKLLQRSGLWSVSTKSFNKNVNKFFFASEGPRYQKPPKVADRIIWVNIMNEGNLERIAAFEGESLLKALQRNRVSNVTGTCDGGEDMNSMTEKPIDPMTYGPFCSNCHVIIADPWRKQMSNLHYLEERNLQESGVPITPNSRLACCVVVEKWMNDMIINIGVNEHVHEENW